MASSSSGPEFFASGSCSYCSKKLFHCPALLGRGQHHCASVPGLPINPQVITQTRNQCCAPTHLPVFPTFPLGLNSSCNCSRCRMTKEAADRHGNMIHHPYMHMTSVNSCWINPGEIHNTSLSDTNFISNRLQSQPCVPPRPTVAQMDGLQLDGVSALSYHHHVHHYHHHHVQSRNNLHPYAMPVFYSGLRRQGRIHHISRHNEENPAQYNFIPNIRSILMSEARAAFERALTRDNREQLENVVNFEDQNADQKPKGISKSALENLPTYRIISKDNEIGESHCVICLMNFKQKEHVRILPCLHEYHSKCIDKWLKSNRSCPVCRKEIKIS